mgnify:CR=1 FL=1
MVTMTQQPLIESLEVVMMMFPYMTLNDDTEITHSEMDADGRVRVFRVCIEKPMDYGFKSATCWLPDYTWQEIKGYSEPEMTYYRQLVRNNAHLILEYARDGGVLNATTA